MDRTPEEQERYEYATDFFNKKREEFNARYKEIEEQANRELQKIRKEMDQILDEIEGIW